MNHRSELHDAAARRVALLGLAGALLAACHRGAQPDAYGNFEATEVVVGAQTSGQLLSFTPREGDHLSAGALAGVVDTTQLALERQQLLAQHASSGARVTQVEQQVAVLQVQQDIARRAYERTRRLFAEQAATAQQLDQAQRDYEVLGKQIDATRAQQRSAGEDAAAAQARVAQIRDQIANSRITAPVSGTVLATYVREGEFVQPGQPLFRIANLDTLELRAYVTGTQLPSLTLGQRVRVHVDSAQGGLLALPGIVSWIASKAEFTPTPVQTRDERADLVYAVKIRVANPRGALKIGMPADVTFGAAPSAPSADTPLPVVPR